MNVLHVSRIIANAEIKIVPARSRFMFDIHHDGVPTILEMVDLGSILENRDSGRSNRFAGEKFFFSREIAALNNKVKRIIRVLDIIIEEEITSVGTIEKATSMFSAIICIRVSDVAEIHHGASAISHQFKRSSKFAFLNRLNGSSAALKIRGACVKDVLSTGDITNGEYSGCGCSSTIGPKRVESASLIKRHKHGVPRIVANLANHLTIHIKEIDHSADQ